MPLQLRCSNYGTDSQGPTAADNEQVRAEEVSQKRNAFTNWSGVRLLEEIVADMYTIRTREADYVDTERDKGGQLFVYMRWRSWTEYKPRNDCIFVKNHVSSPSFTWASL